MHMVYRLEFKQGWGFNKYYKLPVCVCVCVSLFKKGSGSNYSVINKNISAIFPFEFAHPFLLNTEGNWNFIVMVASSCTTVMGIFM